MSREGYETFDRLINTVAEAEEAPIYIANSAEKRISRSDLVD